MTKKPKYKILNRAVESDLNRLYEEGYRIKCVKPVGGNTTGGLSILLELPDELEEHGD